MKDTTKWLLWDGDSDFPFQYATAKEARRDQRLFNAEQRSEWGRSPYILFKRV